MSKKYEKSAKDKAFDLERAKFRQTIRNLELSIDKKDIEIQALKQEVDDQNIIIENQKDWINRLLEYMDMSEEDMKNTIELTKTKTECLERINYFISMFK